MELWRALGALTESPATEQARLAALLELPAVPTREGYTSLFVLQLPPYASIYTSDDGLLGGAARDRVAGFWRVLGATPPAEPDHLAALLGLYATLTEAENAAAEDGRARLHHARRVLFWEHLASWLVAYLPRAASVADDVYRAWVELALSALAAEAEALGAPEVTPAALRQALPLPPLQSLGAAEVAALLLAPVRTGVILTRADLQRAARATELAARVGERRFVLRHLLEQAPQAVFAWLRSEALLQRQVQQSAPVALRPVASLWAERALACGAALDALLVADALTEREA